MHMVQVAERKDERERERVTATVPTRSSTLDQ
jgi:hypothetical protein